MIPVDCVPLPVEPTCRPAWDQRQPRRVGQEVWDRLVRRLVHHHVAKGLAEKGMAVGEPAGGE